MRALARLRGRKVVPQRTAGELDAMAAAGAVVAAALRAVRAAADAGVSSRTLDDIAETVIREAGATPSFLGYHGYPASICVSVNDRVVHGIPSGAEILAAGDLVSVDCGAVLDGWHGDAAITFGVGPLSPADEALSEATRESLEAGIKAMMVGNRLTDVSHAIERGTRTAETRYGPFVRNRRRVRRPRDRPADAPGSVLAQRGRSRARTGAGRGLGAGHRTNVDPWHRQNRGARRQLDSHYCRRIACGTLGAHSCGNRGRAPNPDLWLSG